MTTQEIDREGFLWRSCGSDDEYIRQREAVERREREDAAYRYRVSVLRDADHARCNEEMADALLKQYRRVSDLYQRLVMALTDPKWVLKKLVTLSQSEPDAIKDLVAPAWLAIMQEYEGGEQG